MEYCSLCSWELLCCCCCCCGCVMNSLYIARCLNIVEVRAEVESVLVVLMVAVGEANEMDSLLSSYGFLTALLLLLGREKDEN